VTIAAAWLMQPFDGRREVIWFYAYVE
jgi:hypothetical protein